LYNLYVAPEGFCFDAFCNDDPILDNPKLHGYNVNAKVIITCNIVYAMIINEWNDILFLWKVENFANHVQKYASAFKTNNIMMTMGGDFSYSVASSWFRNMDKLIKYSDFFAHANNIVLNLNAYYTVIRIVQN